MLEEKLIGYAAREMWSDYEQTWSNEPKRNFLLKSDIVKPLSIDPMVLGLIFSPSMLEVIEEREGRVGWRQHTWAQLSKLEHYLNEFNLTDYWLIAITQFMDKVKLVKTGTAFIPVEPDQIAPHWRFLGFDIAEMPKLSGLLNMGYTEQERHNFQRYVPYLNQYHLLTNLDIALSFVEQADKRDPGHGPFYVYGLYKIVSDIADKT